jgi:serine/threonine-protein kinase
VPAVVGKPEAEARSVLEAKGLTVATEQEAQSRVGTDGMVVGQDPGALTRASAGDTVTLTVGHEDAPHTSDTTPPAPFVVPDVVNTSVESAVAALRAGNLVVSIAPPADSPYPSGRVVQQSPAPGTPLPAGTGVTVVPASGSTAVPALAGLCLVQAHEALEAAGLGFGTIKVSVFSALAEYPPAQWTAAAQSRVTGVSSPSRVVVGAQIPVAATLDVGCPVSN